METLPAVVEVHPPEAGEQRDAELERSSGLTRPAVQTAAVVAGSFVAGAASVVLVRRAAARPIRRARRHRELGGVDVLARPVDVLASRSFLIDVHVIENR